MSDVRLHAFEGASLVGNPLGDPTKREVAIYLPPGYDASKTYPALMALIGFGGPSAMLFNIDNYGEHLGQRLDRLITSGACPPVIVAAPNCMTRFGGSQYINSSAIGAYEDYLVKDVVPEVARLHRISHWGICGKSSGGYGAIVQAMRNPDVFRAAADHSGDSNFELCYSGWGKALNAYRRAGGLAKWLDAFWADSYRRRKSEFDALNALAMAAHYSPNPASELGVDFPYDLETGELRAEVWARFSAWDPVRMVPAHAANLKRLACLFVDCGTRDQFDSQWGARALAKALRAHEVPFTYEEFDDDHSGVSYRYDTSLPLLVKALVALGEP